MRSCTHTPLHQRFLQHRNKRLLAAAKGMVTGIFAPVPWMLERDEVAIHAAKTLRDAVREAGWMPQPHTYRIAVVPDDNPHFKDKWMVTIREDWGAYQLVKVPVRNVSFVIAKRMAAPLLYAFEAGMAALYAQFQSRGLPCITLDEVA